MIQSTSEWYLRFANHEAAGHSPTYESLATTVASSAEIIDRLERLPEDKRQPNLLFASVRLLEGPVAIPGAFEDWVVEHWDAVAATMLTRRTQTNEPRRCATLLPFLTAVEGPLALIEVGASAGLCLYPDRWQYRYGTGTVGDPLAPMLSCDVTGALTVPTHPPEVVWRAGVDLNPLDIDDPADIEWLEALIWPEQVERRERLHQAIAVARREPAHLVTGDLNEELAPLAAEAPGDATLVVFHSAVLAYLTPAERSDFVDQVSRLPGHWISNEAPGVLPEMTARIPTARNDPRGRFVTAFDGVPLAWTGSHGQSIELI